MLNTLIQYCNIMLRIKEEGKEQLSEMKLMKELCAFPSEIRAGTFRFTKGG